MLRITWLGGDCGLSVQVDAWRSFVESGGLGAYNEVSILCCMDLHQDPIGKEEVHMTRSASFAAAIFLLLLLGIGSTAWAYRDYFSETQRRN